MVGQSTSLQAACLAVRGVQAASPARSLRVLRVRALAGDVASCGLRTRQEAEGGGEGAEAVDGDGVAGEVVGADRGEEGGLRGVTPEGEGERVRLGGRLGRGQGLQGRGAVHGEALGKLCGV